MKITYKGVTIEFDTTTLKEKSKELFKKLCNEIDNAIVKDYTIALIDDRYAKTGYIIEHGVIHISKNDLEPIRIAPETIPKYLSGGMLLEDIFDTKHLIKSSGELNGYEDDTPELSSFNIVIRL